MSSSDNILTIIVIGAVAYIILTTKQTATGTAAATATATEKAYQATCDYLTPLTLPWFACKMGAYPKPSSTAGTEHSPQTPPPKPDLCPWNSSLLAGDVRCQNPSQNTVIIGKPEPGFTECIIGAPKWDGGC